MHRSTLSFYRTATTTHFSKSQRPFALSREAFTLLRLICITEVSAQSPRINLLPRQLYTFSDDRVTVFELNWSRFCYISIFALLPPNWRRRTPDALKNAFVFSPLWPSDPFTLFSVSMLWNVLRAFVNSVSPFSSFQSNHSDLARVVHRQFVSHSHSISISAMTRFRVRTQWYSEIRCFNFTYMVLAELWSSHNRYFYSLGTFSARYPHLFSIQF